MTTQERLEALERGLSAAKRRNKYLLIGLVLLAVAWAFTSTTGTVQAQTGENVVRAERFELVDSEGRVRAGLGVFNGMPGLLLYDANGTNRVELSVSDRGTGLFLYDANETPRAKLLASDDGSALGLFDTNGKHRAGLTVLAEIGPELYLWDANEHLLWSAP